MERRNGETGQVTQPGYQPVKTYDFCPTCCEGFPTYSELDEA